MELTATKYEQTEVGLIPQGWEIKELGQLAKVIGGGTPKTTVAGYWNGKISWFTPTEVGKQKYLITSNRKITLEGLHSSSAQILPIGTILLTSRAGIGDLGILTKEATTNQGFQSLLVYDEYDNEYVYYLLSTLKPKLLSRASGSTFLEISPSKVKEIRVGVPSTLTEQKAIAQVLTDTDALIQALEKKITKKKLIKKGVMQKLLTPNEDWEVKILGELAEFYKGRGLPKSEIIQEGKYKCLHYGELFTKYKEEIRTILSKTNTLENVFFSKSNDVLMPTSDVTPNGLATASCIREDNIIVGGDVLVIRFSHQIINGTFLSNYITQNRKQVMQLVSGSTVYHLYGSDMSNFVLSYPNIDEQNLIVQTLSDMDKEISHLEKKLSKYQLAKQGMMQKLLTGKIRLV